MSPAECMHVLELGESASVAQIKRGYRRLAQRCHPDKHGGNAERTKQFAVICQAYRSLIRVSRAVASGRSVGSCAVCGEFDEVTRGRDGRLYCRHCVFRPAAGRLLPMPPLAVARCLGTVALLACAMYLLFLALAAEGSSAGALWAGLSFAAGVVSLAWLAWTAVSITHCLTARERAVIENYLAAVRQTLPAGKSHPTRCRASSA